MRSVVVNRLRKGSTIFGDEFFDLRRSISGAGGECDRRNEPRLRKVSFVPQLTEELDNPLR